jgi:hypothetical protein
MKWKWLVKEISQGQPCRGTVLLAGSADWEKQQWAGYLTEASRIVLLDFAAPLAERLQTAWRGQKVAAVIGTKAWETGRLQAFAPEYDMICVAGLEALGNYPGAALESLLAALKPGGVLALGQSIIRPWWLRIFSRPPSPAAWKLPNGLTLGQLTGLLPNPAWRTLISPGEFWLLCRAPAPAGPAVTRTVPHP